MNKSFVTAFFSLLLFFGIVFQVNTANAMMIQKQSDKSKQKYAKKLAKAKDKQKKGFFKRKYKKDTKGKHKSIKGNSYETVK